MLVLAYFDSLAFAYPTSSQKGLKVVTRPQLLHYQAKFVIAEVHYHTIKKFNNCKILKFEYLKYKKGFSSEIKSTKDNF